ncbi:MAG: Lrp/AsnC family transcriptional regulator [Betaproteobacteria bacterium HGW-Betaproteobacteria-14]|nr:Lrp/AsnC family transcriptional regulator [Rhodocyclaceae bacterium]MCP5297023.1 Lrp/AsnC family transcriptional regulator [Zoogloeaceae bacterium]PKO71026.1 MAG: Lrp/AsnC family transcriptional regulator [Betaproteobacteria bacterium HGW-Betaproteobacteria-14]
MDSLDFRLINEFQRDFPLEPRPFAEIAYRLCVDEEIVLAALQRLRGEGVVSRVGAVFAPRRVGASTLAALAAPPGQLDEIAARVSARPEVNHNYEREHRYNLWFVVTARDEAHLAEALAAIERDTGCQVISLPLEHEFYIDLGFDLAGVCKAPCTMRRIEPGDLRDLTMPEQRLMGALQHGLELVPQPFARLGEQSGMDEAEVIAILKRWRAEGLIKRFGVVVRHHELGFTANAMVVWDLPDDEVERVGGLLAAEPEVTLCYQRRRHAPEWPYNLFCMIHGRARGEVEAAAASLRQRHGLSQVPHALLFSRRRFKQRGAHYMPQAEAAHG